MADNGVLKGAVVGAAVFGAAYIAYSMVTKSRKPRPLVVCGPAGVGKGTLLGMIMEEFPGKFGKCVSHTTRAPRAGEVDGVHYHFSTKEQMQKDIDAGLFVEYATVHGNMYGTSIAAIQAVSDAGLICILEIDVQGAEQVRETSLNAYYYFFLPPSFDALEQRMRARGSETEESLNRRLQTAKTELDFMEKCPFVDYKLVNNDLQAAYVEFKARMLSMYPQLK